MERRTPQRATFRDALATFEHTVLDGKGVVPAAERRQASHGEHADEPLAAYLRKVRDAAYRVTDEEVAELRRRGRSDDELFELTVVAACGAARDRLDAGLRAV